MRRKPDPAGRVLLEGVLEIAWDQNEAFLDTGCEHGALLLRIGVVFRGELRVRRASENLMMVRS